MISQKVALAISRFSGSGKYFRYEEYTMLAQTIRRVMGAKKKNFEASPIDVHDDPVELLFDFSGTLEMNLAAWES